MLPVSNESFYTEIGESCFISISDYIWDIMSLHWDVTWTQQVTGPYASWPRVGMASQAGSSHGPWLSLGGLWCWIYSYHSLAIERGSKTIRQQRLTLVITLCLGILVRPWSVNLYDYLVSVWGNMSQQYSTYYPITMGEVVHSIQLNVNRTPKLTISINRVL